MDTVKINKQRRDSTSSNASSFVLSPGTHPSSSDLDGLSDLGSDFELVSEDGDISDVPSSSHGADMSLSYPDPVSQEGNDEASDDERMLSGSSIFRSTPRLPEQPRVVEQMASSGVSAEQELPTPLAQSVATPVEVPQVQSEPEMREKPVEEEVNSIAKTLDVLSAQSPSFWLRLLRAYRPSSGIMSSIVCCAALFAVISGSSYLYGVSPGSVSVPQTRTTIETPVVSLVQPNSLSLFGTPSRALAVADPPACARQRSCEVMVAPTKGQKSFTRLRDSTPVRPWSSMPGSTEPMVNLSTQAAWQAAVDALNVAAEAWTTAHHRVIDVVKRANLTDQSRRALRRSQRYVDRAHANSKRLLVESQRWWDKANREAIGDFGEQWFGRQGKERKRILNRAREGAHKLLERQRRYSEQWSVRRKQRKAQRFNHEIVAHHMAQHRARTSAHI